MDYAGNNIYVEISKIIHYRMYGRYRILPYTYGMKRQPTKFFKYLLARKIFSFQLYKIFHRINVLLLYIC